MYYFTTLYVKYLTLFSFECLATREYEYKVAVSVCCLQLDLQRLLVHNKYTDHTAVISAKVVVFGFCERTTKNKKEATLFSYRKSC